MNTANTAHPNNSQSPLANHTKAQIDRLNTIECQHDAEPDKAAAIIAISLSGIEAGVAFFLLLPAGLLIASIGAMFPVFLLWAMANYHADRVELPKKYDQLVEQYHDTKDL